MTYLVNNGRYNVLSQVFQGCGMTLQVPKGKNYVIIQGSQDRKIEQVIDVFKALKFFCPLFSSRKLEGCWVFTVCPYRLPFFFMESLEDKWEPLNNQRRLVSPSVEGGLKDLLEARSLKEGAIVEIGAGIGYSVPKTLTPRLIRIQPDEEEYLCLTESDASVSVRLMDVQTLLDGMKEKISLFFALNVWDVMGANERMETLERMAKSQTAGGRLLILLDTCPSLHTTFQSLQDAYPERALFPLFPSYENSSLPSKISALVVPQKEVGGDRPCAEDFFKMGVQEAEARMDKQTTTIQEWIQQVKESHPFVVWEDFFVEKMKQELAAVGYKATSFYHMTCTIQKAQKPEHVGLFIYKSVTNSMGAILPWPFEELDSLIPFLQEKGIQIPKYFQDLAYLDQLKKEGNCILGAEFLTIDASLEDRSVL